MQKSIRWPELTEGIKKLAGKKSSSQIAAELNVSQGTVRNTAQELGISLELAETVERIKRIDSLLDQYGNSLSVKEYADLAGVEMARVRYRGKLKGIEFKSEWKKEEPVKKERSKYFRVSARENWLV